MAPTPQSSSEENTALADILRGSKSTDGSLQKNRLTQKRYRERQKLQMEEYRQRVDKLTSQLGQLSTDKTSLARLLSLLLCVYGNQPQEQTNAEEEWNVAVAAFTNCIRQYRQPLTTVEEVRSWTGEDARKFKLDYVSQLATFLAAGADRGNKEAFEQLESYVLECRRARWDLITKQSWRTLAKMMANKPQQPTSPELLHKFLKAAKLTSDQERDLAAAHRAYLERSARFAEERAHILANLQGATNVDAPLLGGAARPSAEGRFSLGALVKAGRASEELKQNVRLEQSSRLTYYTDFTSVVTPLQEANTAVEIYPITLDHHYHFELGQMLCQAREEIDGPLSVACPLSVAPPGGLEQQAPLQPQPYEGNGDLTASQLPAEFMAAATQPPVVDLNSDLPEMDFFDFDDMALEKSDIWQELFPARWGPEA